MVCFRTVEQHHSMCGCCEERWFPPLCCAGCDCQSYEYAHNKLFDLGFKVEDCFFEGVWFLFFIDGAGGIWSDGIFYIGNQVGERGN